MRDRENGAYYDRMFGAALGSGADVVFVTSYNEWGEGTQIEPAVPHTVRQNPIVSYVNSCHRVLPVVAHWPPLPLPLFIVYHFVNTCRCAPGGSRHRDAARDP